MHWAYWYGSEGPAAKRRGDDGAPKWSLFQNGVLNKLILVKIFKHESVVINLSLLVSVLSLFVCLYKKNRCQR